MNRLRNFFLFLIGLCIIFNSIAIASEMTQYHYVFTIQSPDVESEVNFGYSIVCDDGFIVVSEKGSSVGGEVYLFDSSGNIKASIQSPTTKAARFGFSIDFNGKYIVIGDPNLEINGLTYSGNAYIFDIDGNLHATLTPPEPSSSGRFGYAVAINGDKIVVSESGANYGDFSHAGMVYVYDLDGNLLDSIQSPEPFGGGGVGGNFGYSLAFNGNIIAVGEAHTTVDDKLGAGRVFLFGSDGDLIASIESPEPQAQGEFGQSIAVNNDIVLVGEHYAEVDSFSKAGKVHVFDLDGNLLYTLQSPKPEENALFGHKVAASEDLIVVSESGADGVSKNEGLVHLYGLDGTLITSLKAPQPAANSEFGSFVAVSGETIAVGDLSAVQGEYKAGQVHVYQPGSIEPPVSPSGGFPGFPIMSILTALAILYLGRKWMK